MSTDTAGLHITEEEVEVSEYEYEDEDSEDGRLVGESFNRIKAWTQTIKTSAAITKPHTIDEDIENSEYENEDTASKDEQERRLVEESFNRVKVWAQNVRQTKISVVTAMPHITEEEVEKSDYEYDDENMAGEKDSASRAAPVLFPKKTTRRKVIPSPELSKLKCKPPLPSQINKLQRGKNPFETFGDWSETTFRSLEIVFPNFNNGNEITNYLAVPETRYWKDIICFKYENFSSKTLRFSNVQIPIHTDNRYGSLYIYLCIPGFAADALAEAGKKKRPTLVTGRSLDDPARWWKIVNNTNEKFGIINNRTKKFQAKSLEAIFDTTKAGITANVILKFLFRASTSHKQPLNKNTLGRVAVEVERGFITEVDVNIKLPTRNTSEVEAIVTAKDIAPDSLMKRLAELGL